MSQPTPATVEHDEFHDDHGGHDHHADHDHDHGPTPRQRLVSYFSPDRRELLIIFLYAVGVGILNLAVPITAMAVVNSVALATLVQQLIVLCLALLVALFLASILQLLQSVIVEYLQRRMFARMAYQLAYRLPRTPLTAYDRHYGPELINRFFDVMTVQKAAGSLLLDGIALLLQATIGLALLASYDTILLGFDIGLILGLMLLVFLFGRGGVRTAVQESIAKYAVAGWFEEVARHPTAFKGEGGPALAQQRADALTANYLTARANHYRVVFRQVAFALFLQVLASASLLAIGGAMVIDGRLSLGQLVAAEIVVTLVVATFSKIGKHVENYYDLLAALDKLGHLIDHLPSESTGGTNMPLGNGGVALRVHELSHQYQSNRTPTFGKLSFELTPGESLAVVGTNGTGKSTLLEVLIGLRTATHGWVEIDGLDTRDWNRAALSGRVALVDGVTIFEGTVAENLLMGRESLHLADLRNALEAVGLLNEILSLPDGFETRLQPGGAPLSAGQSMRLVLARAIVNQPRLLLLDEAVDGLDAQVREWVLPRILKPQWPCTVILTTHDADLAKRCDRQLQLTVISSTSNRSSGEIS